MYLVSQRLFQRLCQRLCQRQRLIPCFGKSQGQRHNSSSTGVPLSTGGSVQEIWKDENVVNVLNDDVSFSSLGLNHCWPSGWAQWILENIHLGADLPWWQSIVLATLGLRIVAFPFLVQIQRNSVHGSHHAEEMARLQHDFLQTKTQQEKQIALKKLTTYMEVNKCSPLGSIPPIMANGLLMCSMFFALRGMANAPVASLAEGGVLFFPDLLVASPPLAVGVCSLMFIQLKIGADGMNPKNMPPNMQHMGTVMKIMPVLAFPALAYFPAALNVYWFTNNFISIFQALALKNPTVRKKLGIGEMKELDHSKLPKQKGVFEQFRELQQKLKDTEKLSQAEGISIKEAGHRIMSRDEKPIKEIKPLKVQDQDKR